MSVVRSATRAHTRLSSFPTSGIREGLSTRTWLEGHPRNGHAFIPVGACWLNLQEGWWRIFRKTALAGRSFANPDDITQATTVATQQLNARARPWVWGRPAPPTRQLRRRYVYIQ